MYIFSLSSLPSASGQQSKCVSTLVGGASGKTAGTQNVAAARGAKHSCDTDPANKVPKWFKIGQLFAEMVTKTSNFRAAKHLSSIISHVTRHIFYHLNVYYNIKEESDGGIIILNS